MSNSFFNAFTERDPVITWESSYWEREYQVKQVDDELKKNYVHGEGKYKKFCKKNFKKYPTVCPEYGSSVGGILSRPQEWPDLFGSRYAHLLIMDIQTRKAISTN